MKERVLMWFYVCVREKMKEIKKIREKEEEEEEEKILWHLYRISNNGYDWEQQTWITVLDDTLHSELSESEVDTIFSSKRERLTQSTASCCSDQN